MSNVSLIDGHIDEPRNCKKCKNFDTETIGCLYMDADCIIGEMYEPFTNYDRIRNMCVEEMAEFITDIQEDPCNCCNYRSSGKCGGGYDLITCRKGVIEMLESEVTE